MSEGAKYKAAFILIIVFLICFIRSNSYAEVLVYGDAVNDSIRYSANLQMKIEDIHISHAQYRENFAGLFPTINIAARAERYENIDRHSSSTYDAIGNEIVGGYDSAWRTSTYIMGQYYLSHWYKKIFEVSYYKKMRDSSVHQCEAETKKIIRDVTEIFGSLSEGKIKLQYAAEILKRLQEILRIKREAFALGQYSYEDVLKAEADAAGMEKEIAKIKKEISEISLNLSGYTGSRYIENTEVEYLVPTGKLPLTEEKAAIVAMPEYKIRQKEMEAIRSKEKAATFGLLPDISIYGRYDLYNSSPDNLDRAFNDIRPVSYSVGLLISRPIFDGGAKFWARKRANYEIRRQEENLRATYEEKNKAIGTLQAGHEALSKQYTHYMRINEQYGKMLEISKKAYDLGERSKIDILELEKDALTMERDLKITEQSIAIYEKQFALEADLNKYLRDYNGNWACKH
jgi:outer membrane protein TolC